MMTSTRKINSAITQKVAEIRHPVRNLVSGEPPQTAPQNQTEA